MWIGIQSFFLELDVCEELLLQNLVSENVNAKCGRMRKQLVGL